MTDELARLDRLLEGLTRVLEVPGDDATDGSAEPTWQKLDVLEASMGADALSAMLRRQGMSGSDIDEVLAILARRRAGGPERSRGAFLRPRSGVSGADAPLDPRPTAPLA